jgi:hypothetical protein
MIAYQIARLDDDGAWDDFVRRSPQGTPFMLSAMLAACAEKVERWALSDGERVLAVAPVFFDGGGKPCPPPAFMFYQGLLLEPAGDTVGHSGVTRRFRIVEAFLRLLAERHGRLEFHQHWSFEDLRPFQWLNYHEPGRGQFEIRLMYTGVLDLGAARDFDSYLRDVRTLRRREFRRAEATCRYEATADIEGLIDLHDRTYARQGITLAPDLRDLRRRIVAAGLRAGFGRLTQAVTPDGVASMIYFLYLGGTAYYLFGANDPDRRDSGASTGLMLHLIQDAFARGLERVDFCGINSPTRGDYKVSFGGLPRPYFMTRFERPAAKTAAKDG